MENIILTILATIEVIFIIAIILGLIIASISFSRAFPKSKLRGDSKKYVSKFEHMEKQELWVTNDRGKNLHGYLYKNKKQNKEKKRTLILCSHGWKSDGTTFVCNKHLWMFEKYDVLVIDHEGFGKSEGKSTGFGLSDTLNISNWCYKMAKEYDGNVNIILYGGSMGANIVMLAANQRLVGVKGIISDSGFSSAYDQFLNITRNKYLTMVCSVFVPLFWRHNLTKYDVKLYLRGSRYPVYFINGKEDKSVSYQMTQQNFEACTSKRYIWIVDKASHNEAFNVQEKEYITRMDSFIKECVSEEE